MDCFFRVDFQSYLYIVDNSPLSDMRFANISSQYAACPFILFTVLHKAKLLNFDEIYFITFFLLQMVFLVSRYKLFTKSNILKIFFYIFPPSLALGLKVFIKIICQKDYPFCTELLLYLSHKSVGCSWWICFQVLPSVPLINVSIPPPIFSGLIPAAL